jgi:hypothetical protein
MKLWVPTLAAFLFLRLGWDSTMPGAPSIRALCGWVGYHEPDGAQAYIIFKWNLWNYAIDEPKKAYQLK